MVGAAVGCAVQIMAYGFSGVVVHSKNALLKIVLISLMASALSLSVLSSYATLTGYFAALEGEKLAQQNSAQQKERAVQAALAQRLELVESMSRDVALGSEAADQGLADKYRTQAKQFLQNNQQMRSDLEQQIEKLEALAQSDLLEGKSPAKGSPIDGLASVLGGQNTAIAILCAWLAVMFDALPIAGITLLESRKKMKIKGADGDDEVFADALAESHPEAIEFQRFAKEDFGAHSFDDEHEQKYLPEQEKPEPEFKILTNICAQDLNASKAFFVDLLGFEVKYESDWYVQLCSPLDSDLEFGIIQRDHQLVPLDYQQPPTGMYMTFLVRDVNETYQRALHLGVDIIQEPRDEFYGLRRFLAREPNGCLVDVCSPSEA